VREVWRAFASALLLIVLPLTPASAHKLRAFAFVEGAVIHGSAYFADNAPAQGAHIRVIDPAGVVMAETTSDAQGRFSVVAQQRVDQRIVADAGDGHQSEYTVTAAELPSSLPAPATRPAVSATAVAPSEPDAASVLPGMSHEALEAMVERAVARQVGPLREQLAGYEDRVRWHDVLGGLGYILGVTGLAIWLRSGRGRS
jgi:nickel transport protein